MSIHLSVDASDTAPLTELQAPPTELAIVGGGMSGLSIGAALLGRRFGCRLGGYARVGGRVPDPVGDLKDVRLLAGGASIAYMPVGDPFAQYLTLPGTDTRRRDATLQEFRKIVHDGFKSEGFQFQLERYALRIRDTAAGHFEIDSIEHGQHHRVIAERLILAIGHALKNIQPELRSAIIQGSGDLCRRLSDELTQGALGQEHSLDRVVARYPTLRDGAIHIGLVGFGATALEVLKIFDSLLDSSTGTYRTPITGLPVKLVLFDPKFPAREAPVEYIVGDVKDRLSFIMTSDESEQFITTNELRACESAIEARLRRIAAQQCDGFIARRIEWDSVRVHSSGVLARDSSGDIHLVSCLIDCAPFIEGINDHQKQVIEGIQPLHFAEVSGGVWQVEIDQDRADGRIALAGAAFTPKSQWSAHGFGVRAKEILADMFPS